MSKAPWLTSYSVTSKVPSLTARGTTCGSVGRWLHKPHITILRPRASTSQSSVVVTHFILAAAHFTHPGGMES